MLNVTIQNDGKIKIQSECSNTKEMRSNVNLLLAVVSSMETEEAAANKEPNGVQGQTKGYINSYCAGKKVISFTGNRDEVEKFAKKFDSSECLRVCISKH